MREESHLAPGCLQGWTKQTDDGSAIEEGPVDAIFLSHLLQQLTDRETGHGLRNVTA